MSWETILKRPSKELVKDNAQELANRMNRPIYFYQNINNGRWEYMKNPPINVDYEIINPMVRTEEEGFSESFQDANKMEKKYSDDTLVDDFDNIEDLVDSMIKNDVLNGKKLRSIVLENIKSGKIKEGKEKEYLQRCRKYVTRKHGYRKQWDDLVESGKF